MKVFKRLIACLVLILLLFGLFPPPPIYSGDLSNTTLRLTRQKISTSSGGMVCAQTPSSDNGTEASVQVIFPTGFTVNSTASNWTVTTSNLANGATAWPGIDTATAVSGQIVTFPSTNLSANTLYCFNFSSSSTLTNPSSAGNYSGTIRTRTSGAATIDSRDYGVAIVSNEQITVTATVAASPTDYQVSLAKTSPASSTFAQDTTIAYQLTYGTTLNYATSITVEAQWSLGTIEGSGAPTVSALNYVVGSASNGYNSTAPVIDTTNRKITWTISSFPGNTSNQTVTFSLKTTDNYTGSLDVDFTTSGRVLGPGTQTSDSDVNGTYIYNYGITPTPQSAAAPGGDGRSDGRSDGRGGSTTTNSPLAIGDVGVRTISATNATIFVETNKASSVTLSYGTSRNSLINTVTSGNTLQHLLKLQNLTPNTQYYFRITARSESETATSDLFTFTTALDIPPPEIDNNSLNITVGDVILSDPSKALNNIARIVLPTNTAYSFKFMISNFKNIKDVRVIARNKNVLGANTLGNRGLSTNEVSLSEVNPGQYIGRLQSDQNPETYQIFVSVSDFNGNIAEQLLAELHVKRPFTIVSARDNSPVENARVTIYYLHPRFKTYELISKNLLEIQNPEYSNIEGIVDIALPQAKYRAEIEALGFATKTVDFEIGIGPGQGYPQVKLEPTGFGFIETITFIVVVAGDVFSTFNSLIQELGFSNRMFGFLALITAIEFTILLFFSFAVYFAVTPWRLPFYIFYHLTAFLRKDKNGQIIKGTVINREDGYGVKGILVYIHKGLGKVIGHTITNSFGEFYIRVPSSGSYSITTMHKSFKSTPSFRVENASGVQKIYIEEKRLNKLSLFLHKTGWYGGYLLCDFIELSLLITLVIEILFVVNLGFLKTLPFLILAISNFILLLYFRKHKDEAKIR